MFHSKEGGMLYTYLPARVVILDYRLVPSPLVFGWRLPPTAFCLATSLYELQLINVLPNTRQGGGGNTFNTNMKVS